MGSFSVWLLAKRDEETKDTGAKIVQGVSVHFSCHDEALSHVVTDTAGGSSALYSLTSRFTPRHPQPASLSSLTQVEPAPRVTAGCSVLLRAVHSAL